MWQACMYMRHLFSCWKWEFGWISSSRQLTFQLYSWTSEHYSTWRQSHLSLWLIVVLRLVSAGDVPVSTHSEGHSLWDTRPRQSSSAHTLGTDGLRCPVHIFTQIPHYLTNCSVSMFEKSITELDIWFALSLSIWWLNQHVVKYVFD